MASKFEQLMQAQMDRRQFLLAMGTGLISLVGLSALLGFFAKNETKAPERPGYGQQKYGP